MKRAKELFLCFCGGCAGLLFFVCFSCCQRLVEPFRRFILQSFGCLGIFLKQSLLTEQQVLIGHGVVITWILLDRLVHILQTFGDQLCLLLLGKRILFVINENPIGRSNCVVRYG